MKHDFNTLHLLWAIRNIPKNVINGHEKSILFILLSSTGHDNISWYSLQSIADMASFSLDTIRRNLKTLAEKNFITIKKPSVYNRTASNQYSLKIDQIMGYSTIDKDSSQPPLHKRRVAGSNGRVAGSKGERVADSTTKKESLERKEEGRKRASREAQTPPPNERGNWDHLPPTQRPGYVYSDPMEEYLKRPMPKTDAQKH